MEKSIKLAAKLYQYRDTAKRFHGDKYLEKLKPYIELIKAVMKENNVDETNALLMITNPEKFKLSENAMAKVMFIAATVEMIEPS